MLREKIAVRELSWVKGLSLAIFSSLLLAISAKVKICLPFTPVPITGQTLALFLIALLLKPPFNALSVAFYILFGMLGLPYFAGAHAGLSYLFGPTGGYLIGFLVAVCFISKLAKPEMSLWKIGLILSLANLVIYILGCTQLGVWLNLVQGKAVNFKTVLSMGALPFIPGDFLKILVALGIYRGWYVCKSSRRFGKDN